MQTLKHSTSRIPISWSLHWYLYLFFSDHCLQSYMDECALLSKCPSYISATAALYSKMYWFWDTLVIWTRPSYTPVFSMSWSPSVRHSFLQFSPTCLDVLCWHFVCHFLRINSRSSSSIVNFRPLELRMLEIHSFPHFSLTCFDILSWLFCIWLCFIVLQIKFECRQFE